MSTVENPLVSCLCVTRKRIPLLKRAVACFHSQTYSPLELIVVVESDDNETMTFMNEIEGGNIRKLVVERTEGQRLGDLRNIAIESARGEYICQWDDDDWYHPDRVTAQVTAATVNGKAGSILTHWVMYDVEHGKAYLSGERLWEGSILVRKSELIKHSIRYPSLSRGEDNVFITSLTERSSIHALLAPSLYIYTFHGNNTWDRGHFQYNFNVGRQLHNEMSNMIRLILTGELTSDRVVEVLQSSDLRNIQS